MRNQLFAAILAGAALLSSPAMAQFHPQTFAWREEPVERDALIGGLGAIYPFVDRAASRMGGRDERRFGSLTDSAGMRGLCELRTLTVWVSEADRAPTGSFQSTVYSAVSDTAPGPWDDTYAARLADTCGASEDGRRFFTADDAVTARYAVRLLSVLQAWAETEPVEFISDLACTGEHYCLTDIALMRAATPANLVSVEQRPCEAFDLLSDDSYVSVLRSGCMTMVVNVDRTDGAILLLDVGVIFEKAPGEDFAADPIPRSVAVLLNPVIVD